MDLRGVVLDYGGVLDDPGDDQGNQAEPRLRSVMRRARAAGIRTALLSNADGGLREAAGMCELFDAVVLSGEVGLAKPAEEIYQLTARRLGLSPGQCVFVDDLPANVAGAVAAGMVGVHHRDVRTTVAELEVLLGRPLLP